MAPHKPPRSRQEAAAGASDRSGQAFAAMQAHAAAAHPEPQEHEQQENGLLDELGQLLARAGQLLTQMRQGQAPAGPEAEPEQAQPPGGALP